MSAHSCLNCGHTLSDLYCEKCGQISTTHRFSLNHIFAHDFIHGMFHIHKGFFFTIKELFIRPGHATRHYIEGKRVKYFNYFTLLVLAITISHILSELSPVKLSDLIAVDESSRQFTDVIGKFSKEYPKLFTFSTIPVMALFSWFWFRRAKQTYAENLVLNSYRAAGEVIIGAVFAIVTIFIHDLSILRIAYVFLVVAVYLYSLIFYYQYFSGFNYTKGKLAYLTIMTSLSLIILTFVVTVAIMIIKMTYFKH